MQFIPIKDLEVSKIYKEDIPAEPEPNPDRAKVLILKKDIENKLVAVYLIGYYELTEKGKDFLLANIGDLNVIPLDDYRNNEQGFFFNKYGFEDEGIIFYDEFTDDETVCNEYVGSIKFYDPEDYIPPAPPEPKPKSNLSRTELKNLKNLGLMGLTEDTLPHPNVNPTGVLLLTTEIITLIGEFQAESKEENENIICGLETIIKQLKQS